MCLLFDQSLPVTLASPQQAHLPFQPVLLLSGNGLAQAGLLTGPCQCNFKQAWSWKTFKGTGGHPAGDVVGVLRGKWLPLATNSDFRKSRGVLGLGNWQAS